MKLSLRTKRAKVGFWNEINSLLSRSKTSKKMCLRNDNDKYFSLHSPWNALILNLKKQRQPCLAICGKTKPKFQVERDTKKRQPNLEMCRFNIEGNGEGKTKLLDERSTSCKIYQRMLAYLEVPWCDYVANNFIGNQRPIIQSFNSSFKLTDWNLN